MTAGGGIEADAAPNRNHRLAADDNQGTVAAG